MSSTQLFSMLALVKIPVMPIKLGMFYKSMGMIPLDFLPNLFALIIPNFPGNDTINRDYTQFHPNIF